MMAQQRQLSSADVAKDMADQELTFVSVLVDKLNDELIARLSELAEPKIGRLTFHFASLKLRTLETEAEAFANFIKRHKFDRKRNYDISHKELPEEWSDHEHLVIPYRIVLETVAHVTRLMKKIDRIVLGPAAPYLWREMRKKRYHLMNPAGAAYMILPYLNLSKKIRGKVILEEMAEGRDVWSEMTARINGCEGKVYACKSWGAILLGNELVVLDGYPLQDLQDIKFDSTNEPPKLGKPIYEQKKIKAKYKVAEVSGDKALFAPSQRVHLLEQGAFTELPNLTVNLSDEMKRSMGAINVGDVKEFSLNVTVLTGYAVQTESESPK